MQLQCILSNVSKTVLLTRSSVVVTLRTVRASTTKCRSGTRQAMLLSSSASWPWYWDSDGSWGLSWQSWFPWGWCGFGLVALARFSRSNLPRNVSNSDNQGEEPPPWTKKDQWLNHKNIPWQVMWFLWLSSCLGYQGKQKRSPPTARQLNWSTSSQNWSICSLGCPLISSSHGFNPYPSTSTSPPSYFLFWCFLPFQLALAALPGLSEAEWHYCCCSSRRSRSNPCYLSQSPSPLSQSWISFVLLSYEVCWSHGDFK